MSPIAKVKGMAVKGKPKLTKSFTLAPKSLTGSKRK